MFPFAAQLSALREIPDGFRTPEQTKELIRLSELWAKWLTQRGRRAARERAAKAEQEKEARRTQRQAVPPWLKSFEAWWAKREAARERYEARHAEARRKREAKRATKVAAQREKDARRVAREAAREAKRQAKEAGRKVWEENMRKAAEKRCPRCPHCGLTLSAPGE